VRRRINMPLKRSEVHTWRTCQSWPLEHLSNEKSLLLSPQETEFISGCKSLAIAQRE
jgi:hypothetical protein